MTAPKIESKQLFYDEYLGTLYTLDPRAESRTIAEFDDEPSSIEELEDVCKRYNYHERLVEALKPFSAVETYDNKDHETCALFFSAGDIRRAQALLREIEGGKGEE